MSFENVEIKSQNAFGKLSFCKDCKCYRLAFSNVVLEYDREKLDKFSAYLDDVNVDYWLRNNKTDKKRCIPLHTAQKDLVLHFDLKEFNALKDLVQGFSQKSTFLSILDIDCPLHLN